MSNAYHFDWSRNMQLKARVMLKGHAVSANDISETGFTGKVKSKSFELFR